jgi:hypothetical protein
MIAGILIIAFSLILFMYWFRYSCLLLLRNAAERSATAFEAEERFSVARVIEGLKSHNELDPLEHALERDYHVLTYLIEHAADLELASIENRILLFDYKVMRLWSHLTRQAAPEQSRRALTEMASILGVLVHKMGEQSGMHVEA